MVSLKLRVYLYFIASTLVVSTLGRSLSPRKDKSFLVISKMDIGAIVRNVRAESCGDKVKVFNFTVKQIRHRPPVFKFWLQFMSKVDVFALDYSITAFLDGKEVYWFGRFDNKIYKYLPVYKNEIYTITGENKRAGIRPLPKGHYTATLTAINQDGVQFGCFHFSGYVE